VRFAAIVLLIGTAGVAADFDGVAQQAAAALQKDPPEAARLYGQAVGMRPRWAEGWFYLGASRYELRQFAEARDAFQRVTMLAPGNGGAWAFLGLCENELHDNKAALEHIDRGEKLGLPDNPQFVAAVRLCAAEICLRGSEFTLAIGELRPLAIAGNESDAIDQAFGEAALGIADASIAAGKSALVELAGKALWAMYAENPDRASTLFAQLEAEYPAEAGVHYACGVYQLNTNADKALDEFREELKVNPGHVFARVQMALLLLQDGRARDAVQPAREAVSLQPQNFLCHVALGRALLETGQTEAAIAEFAAAAKLAPDNPQVHFHLAQAYRRAGRAGEARKQEEEFARLNALERPKLAEEQAR